jgi:hypothetical protein
MIGAPGTGKSMLAQRLLRTEKHLFCIGKGAGKD